MSVPYATVTTLTNNPRNRGIFGTDEICEALARVLNGQNHYGQICAVDALCNLTHDHPGNQTRFATKAITQALENVHRDAPPNNRSNIDEIIVSVTI